MTIPFIIAGLILRLTSGWFNGQHTVGDILLWVGVVGVAIQLVFMVVVGAGMFATRKRW